ncbi:MAG: hypothetical protein IPH75_16400 [bacterium]|nr:hypothetical protein [bacterium]
MDTLPDSIALIDQSILTGRRIYFDFEYGVLDRVTSIGQAYSWYYPAKKGGMNRASMPSPAIRSSSQLPMSSYSLSPSWVERSAYFIQHQKQERRFNCHH